MLRKLKQSYRDMGIRRKMIAVFVGSFVCFLSLVLVLVNVILYHSNITKAQQNIQDECGMIQLQLTSLYNNLRNCENSTLQGINQTYRLNEGEETDQVSFVSVKNSLSSVLSYYRSCFQDVDSMVFVDMQGNVVSTGLGRTPAKTELSDLIGQIPSFGPVNAVTFPVEKREYFTGDEAEGILTQGKRVINADTGENVGYLFVNVKTSTIADIFPENSEGAYRKNYYIVDERDKIVVTRTQEKELLQDVEADFATQVRTEGEEGFQREHMLVTGRASTQFQWTVVNETPIHDVMRDIYFMTSVIIAAGLLCILLAALVILILSRMITGPIKALTDTAEQISAGELSRRCVVDRQDEVGVLSQTFNVMVERIQNLLMQVKVEQKQKRETELALFQVQIKPHFLYNTLDLIYVCCEMEEGQVGGKIAKALADYYRTCLSGGEEVISIGEELQNIENYLFIQKERYSDIISYTIDAPEDCRKYKLPKMTLQPLVENAIYHGLKEKDGVGCITIGVEDCGDGLVLTVADDGVGMDAGTFEKILCQKEKRGKKHFGLKNVHERIQLYFGEEYGLCADPEWKEGTCIRIRIPKLEVYHD